MCVMCEPKWENTDPAAYLAARLASVEQFAAAWGTGAVPRDEWQAVRALLAEYACLRAALERIGDAAEVCLLGDQDPAALIGWVERTAREALTPAAASA